jgi:hypothetical protein
VEVHLSQSIRKFATFRQRNLQHAPVILIDKAPYFRRKPMYTVADVSVITGLSDDFIIRTFISTVSYERSFPTKAMA